MRFARFTLLIGALVAGLLAADVRAVDAQEVQVPIDSEGRVDQIDRALAGRIGLFLDRHPDFQVARLFQGEDGAFVLELTMRRDGRTLRERVALSDAEARDLRQRVSAAIAARAPAAGMDREGRTLFIAGTTLLGAGFYGWAVPAVLDVESGRGALALYMFTTAASIAGPYLLTQNRPVSYGQANAWWWGATRGITHGLYATELVSDNASSRQLLGGALFGSLVEGIAGYQWAGRTGMSAGTAHTIGNFGDLGAFWAGGALLIAQPDVDEDLAIATLLAGAGAGIAGGARFADSRDFTWGDAEIMRTAALVGAADGLALWDLLTTDDGEDFELRVLGTTLVAGSILGVVASDRMLDGRDFSVGQSVLIQLGAFAGYAAGVGISLLASDDAESGLLTSLGAAGGTLGFTLLFNSLSDDAERRERRDRGDTEDGSSQNGDARGELRGRANDDPLGGRFRIYLDPAALGRLATPLVAPGVTPSAGIAALPASPLLTISYVF